MALAAAISANEVRDQVTDRFVDKYLEARLISATGTVYTPGENTDDALFLGFEVPEGQGGYRRQVFSYGLADVLTYSDDGVGMSTRATVFAQNGTSTAINFSHVALCWSTGNIMAYDSSLVSRPGSGDSVDGVYSNIPIDSTDGTGRDALIDLTIASGGTNYSIEIQGAGVGYEVGDTVTILSGTLLGIGATNGGTTDLALTVDSVSSNPDAGNIVAVAQTSSEVNLNGGNEAVFYWNIKQFGFYATSSS